ncbi:MAG: exodeoxyribonuclease VII large subunit [Rikenellaceae bacterium]
MQHITLSQLQSKIKFTLEDNFSECWVAAEINEINVNNSGHCYIMFVEKGGDNQVPRAKISGVIWRSQYTMLNSFFREATGQPLHSGIKVLVKVSVNYHELYGISLVVKDIDPTYTLGDMERQRQECINKLKEDGIFEMNKELDMPLVPQRIAVISSDKAAGYQDFINELNGNEYGYHFTTSLYVAFMQGEEAERSIIEALNAIADKMDDFDTIAIIRGGGSQSDLACFNSYRICSYIAQFPLPILTGIGHNKDVSVADMVSFVSLKTPTAVAGWFVDRAHSFEQKIDKYGELIVKSARDVLQLKSQNIDLLWQQLRHNTSESIHANEMLLNTLHREIFAKSSTLIKMESQKQIQLFNYLKERSVRVIVSRGEKVDGYINDIKTLYGLFLARRLSQVELLDSKIKGFDPDRILKMGYSIATIGGKSVKSAKDVSVGQKIDIRLTDGTVKTQVI